MQAGRDHLAGLALVTVLWLAGLAHWSDFLRDAGFTAYDWRKEMTYLDVTRQAIVTGTLPYHYSTTEYVGGQRFLGNLDVGLPPYVLLLPWLSNRQFVLIHLLMFYTAGFAGLVTLSRRLKLSALPFTAMVLLFNLNGHHSAHLAVGHLQWAALFLLPWLANGLIAWCDDDRPAMVRSLPMAVTIAAMIWVGGLHVAVWSLMLLGMFALFRRAAFLPALATVGLVVLLAAARVFPAAFAFWKYERPFRGGFRSPMHLLESLTTIQPAMYLPGYAQGWWEYDTFIGTAGLILLASGMAMAWREPRLSRYSPLSIPLILMALASLGRWYGWIAALPIPFASVERATSRFLVVPVLFGFAFALSAWSDTIKRAAWARIAFVVTLPVLAIELMVHRAAWTPRAVEQIDAAPEPMPWALITVDDPAYKLAVVAGWSITAAAVLGITAAGLRRLNSTPSGD